MKLVLSLVVASAATSALANVPSVEEFGIFSPCDDALAEVVWLGSDAGYTGELSWIHPYEGEADVLLWTNHGAAEQQSFEIPIRFAKGERVDFSYEIIAGRYDFFSTANEQDWAQFEIDSSDPHNILVGIEDIRLPGGDRDYNDAEFRVSFDCDTPVPSPGSLALLAVGGVIGTRRRR